MNALGLNSKYVYDFLVILFLIIIVIVFYYFDEIKKQFYLRGAYDDLKKNWKETKLINLLIRIFFWFYFFLF